MIRNPERRRALAATMVLGTSLLAGCAPVIVGGAMIGGVLAATDRRTTGTQLEDQAIELKAASRVREVLADRGHVNATSYNRLVLITGEVPSEADRVAVEQAVAKVENVKSVVNELGVMGNSSFTSRSNDAILASKVKATFVDAKDLMANASKVTAERGTIYLMGRVTEREAAIATELARSVGGVQRVVRVFEFISEAELARMLPPPQPAR